MQLPLALIVQLCLRMWRDGISTDVCTEISQPPGTHMLMPRVSTWNGAMCTLRPWLLPFRAAMMGCGTAAVCRTVFTALRRSATEATLRSLASSYSGGSGNTGCAAACGLPPALVGVSPSMPIRLPRSADHLQPCAQGLFQQCACGKRSWAKGAKRDTQFPMMAAGPQVHL
jgi:hypothetical protein